MVPRVLTFTLLLYPFIAASSPADEPLESGSLCKTLVAAFAEGGGTKKFPHLGSESHAFSLTLRDPLNKPASRTIRLFPNDPWGEHSSVQGKTFSLHVSVDSKEEARDIVEQIIKASPHFSKMKESNGLRNGLEIPGVLWGYIKEPQQNVGLRLPDENFRELIVTLPNNDQKAINSVHLAQALLRLGLETRKDPVNLSTASGRREWAYYSSLNWAQSLSSEETTALREMGGPAYKDINRALRQPGGINSTTSYSVKEWVRNLDTSIGRATIDHPIVLYRSDSRADLVALWESLEKGASPVSSTIAPDPGFQIASLERPVAEIWNHAYLESNGILIKINVPKGGHAAYLDARGIHEDRGYQEFVMPRNARYRPIAARSEAGKRVLEVELVL